MAVVLGLFAKWLICRVCCMPAALRTLRQRGNDLFQSIFNFIKSTLRYILSLIINLIINNNKLYLFYPYMINKLKMLLWFEKPESPA